ncbi:hypothetical protein B484DRAFT_411316 [Ochromonadaceae sp. CCMP2298]|nr:hypothetical protein B484DRAFT_411316 [Ochromonadaceae sp. CCMP2298]
MDKAREQGRTQASGKGDGKGDRDTPVSRRQRPPRSASADNAINITCFRCGQYGHPMVECPHGKKLDAFQKTLPNPTVTEPKAKPAARPAVSKKTAAAAALAALTEDDGDDEGDKDAQEGEVSGAAMCTEPMSMDDWLTTEHTCVAYSSTEPANESPAPPPDSESDWEDWLPTDTHDYGSVSDSEPYSSSAADFSTCPPTYGIVTGPHGEQTMLSPPPRYGPQGSGAQVALSVPGQLVSPSQSSQLVLLGDRGTAGWESEAAGAAHAPSQSSQPVAPESDDHEPDCLCDDCIKVPPLVDVGPAHYDDDHNPSHDSGNTVHVPPPGFFNSEGEYELSQLHVDAVG